MVEGDGGYRTDRRSTPTDQMRGAMGRAAVEAHAYNDQGQRYCETAAYAVDQLAKAADPAGGAVRKDFRRAPPRSGSASLFLQGCSLRPNSRAGWGAERLLWSAPKAQPDPRALERIGRPVYQFNLTRDETLGLVRLQK